MAAETKPLRKDAARNRDKLLTAASRVFAERGLAAPLEEVARQAKVSIGTLYNHFPHRDALLDAIFPDRVAALDQIAVRSLEEPDPWTGFVGFVEGLFALQAEDRGLNEALANRHRDAEALNKACDRGFMHVDRIIGRAQQSGQLRKDFQSQDLATLIWAMSQVIQASASVAPDQWRRCLAFFLDGLRSDAAHPISVPALTPEQLGTALRS